MNNDIKEISVSRFLTPDGKSFDTLEAAEEYVTEQNRLEEAKDTMLVKENVQIPRMLHDAYMNYTISLMSEVFDLYKVNSYAEYLKLTKLLKVSNLPSVDANFKKNNYEYPCFLLNGRKLMRKLIPIDKVIEDCNDIERKCDEFKAQKNEFIEFVNLLKGEE